jgi:CheY-like chemotaxis protein
VVEDDEDLRHVYVHMLEGRGHTVYCAWTAIGAITQLELCKPDFMILDLDLGGYLGGREVAEHLPQDARGSTIPFAVVTGRSIRDVRPRLIRNPFATCIWIEKDSHLPENLETLMSNIDRSVFPPEEGSTADEVLEPITRND